MGSRREVEINDESPFTTLSASVENSCHIICHDCYIICHDIESMCCQVHSLRMLIVTSVRCCPSLSAASMREQQENEEKDEHKLH